MPMPLPKLFEFAAKIEAEANGGAAGDYASGSTSPARANPKAKARPVRSESMFSTMTPSPHYAGLHPGLSYTFGRPGSGEVIRVSGAKSEDAADGDGLPDSANEFDSLMGWANDTSDDPAALRESSKTPPTPLDFSSNGSPTHYDKKVVGSPLRGSSSPMTKSPLQTILEERPDIGPPAILSLSTLREKPDEES
jgi:hypothetical protein